MARLLVVGAFLGGAVADTVSNCGSDSDHVKVTKISTDADSTGGPKKGEPFSITVEGEFDGAHQHGVISGSLAIKALGIVHETVDIDQQYDFYPGLPSGTNSVTIGPFTFPTSIPGEVLVDGRISIVDESAEAVACIDLAVNIPKLNFFEEKVQTKSAATCGDASSDHITNVQTTSSDAGVKTTTMDLDEDLSSINLLTDLSVKASFLPAVGFKLSHVPISVSPAIPAGQLTFVGYPSSSASNSAVQLGGTLTLEDSNGDEVICVDLSSSAEAVSV